VVHSPSTPAKLRLRAGVVLGASRGATNRKLAEELGTDPGTAARWRQRFLLHGTPGILKDAPRPGRPPTIPDSKVDLVVRSTVGYGLPESRNRSARRLATETGVSKSTVQRIWKARKIGPHRPSDPSGGGKGIGFLDKVTDMVGLYLNPPERAIAFSTDERLRGSMLETGELRAIANLQRRSQRAEFRAFLQVIDRETPPRLDVHLLLDSRLAPTPPPVARWLAQHPRFHFHYLPSDQAGSTLIDRLVTEFSRRKVGLGETPSTQRLRRGIREHFRANRATPNPFVWTTTAEDVRDPLARGTIQY
jgi:Homeodomain-like domain